MNRAISRPTLMIAGLLLAGCGDEATSPTPTQPPPGDAPGESVTLGAVSVAYVQGYDLQTGVPGGTDIASTALGAGFLNPNSESAGGDLQDLPIPAGLPIPEGGIALDSCSALDLSAFLEGGGRMAPAALLGLWPPPRDAARGSSLDSATPAEEGPLVTAGERVQMLINNDQVDLPLVQEEDLPPPLAGQPLPPFYLHTVQGLDPALYNPQAQYGLAASGSAAIAAFNLAPFFAPPRPLEVTEPEALGEGGDVDLSSDLTFEWLPGDGAYALIDLHALSGPGLLCLVVDDGRFTIAAGQLGTLPSEEGLLTIGRVSSAQGEVRLNERMVGVGVVLEVAQVQLN